MKLPWPFDDSEVAVGKEWFRKTIRGAIWAALAAAIGYIYAEWQELGDISEGLKTGGAAAVVLTALREMIKDRSL